MTSVSLLSYEEFYERIQREATAGGLADLAACREEFHQLTGKFEDGEPWFELRMSLFLDWYLLDRPGADGLTPAEVFLKNNYHRLDKAHQRQAEYLTTTHRSVFELMERHGDDFLMVDLIGGGHWQVCCTHPMGGLAPQDIFGARMVYYDGGIKMGRGIVLHPHEASGIIKEIIGAAIREGMDQRNLCAYLDKMRLKLDRYSNVRIQHVYRHPKDVLF